MLKIALCGALGKMGTVVADSAKDSENLKIVVGIDKFANNTVLDFPLYNSFNKIKDVNFDVIIDFSHPDNLTEILKFSEKHNIPVVLATTGYSDKQIEEIKESSKIVPVFFTFNMSLGINLLTLLSKKAAEVLGEDFDIEIIEKHHNQKIDAPSGTALMLAKALDSARKENMQFEYDRHSKRQKRAKNEIGIHSVRGGTIVGEHEVIFAGDNEVISLSHSAQSKTVFAKGALRAASFIADCPPGIYSMDDMIK